MSGSIKCIPARADVHKAQPLDWRPLARPFERGEAVDTYAQAIVQGRGSLGDRLLSQTDDPSLRRRVPEAVGSAERPCHAKRPGSYHKADPFIVHQLAVLASQALRFVSSVRAV
jgi:hypothetical protein